MLEMHPRRSGLRLLAAPALLAVLVACVPAAEAAQKRKGDRLVASVNGWASTTTNRGEGGGARFVCRARLGVRRSCLRSRNMRGGLAFVFATSGRLGGLLTVGRGGDDVSPFSTNATGVASGLNADRVDGRDASDFLLAGGKAADSDQLDGFDAADFLRSDGTASNSNLLDGLDSAAFLLVGGKAADSDTLDGLDSTDFALAGAPVGDADTVDGRHASDFLAASRLVSLGGDPRMDEGDPVSTIGAGGGLTFKASCASGGGGTTVSVLMSVDSGSARFAFVEPATVGSSQVDVSSADGDVEVLTTDGGTIGSDTVTPVQVAVVRDDGTTLSGTLTVGVGFGPSDCFVSGSLMG